MNSKISNKIIIADASPLHSAVINAIDNVRVNIWVVDLLVQTPHAQSVSTKIIQPKLQH